MYPQAGRMDKKGIHQEKNNNDVKLFANLQWQHTIKVSFVSQTLVHVLFFSYFSTQDTVSKSLHYY